MNCKCNIWSVVKEKEEIYSGSEVKLIVNEVVTKFFAHSDDKLPRRLKAVIAQVLAHVM